VLFERDGRQSREREKEREREREREAGRGRDACYETTARESPVKRGEERRGEERRGEERRGEERRGEERRGEEKRGEPVGRALCASGRSFSISPFRPARPPIRPSRVHHLHLSFSLRLLSPSRFFPSSSLSLVYFTVSPWLSLSLPSSLLFSPFLPFALPPFPRTPSTFRYHLGARLGLK